MIKKYKALLCGFLLMLPGLNTVCSSERMKKFQTGRYPLHDAAERGDLTQVSTVLKQGKRVDARNNHTQTALHIAARNNDIALLRLLIQKGAAINVKDKNGNTPLHYAAHRGHIESMRLLLTKTHKRVHRNPLNKQWETPLHTAAGSGNTKIVELLLKHGAAVNRTSLQHRRTALHYASINGHTSIVELLIAKDAHVLLRDALGNTPLDYAILSSHDTTAHLLLQKGGLDKSCKRTPLHIACSTNNFTMVDYFVRAGFDINGQDYEGRTPLHYASESGSCDTARYLLLNGAHVNTKATMYRLVQGQPTIRLLEYTPLHVAAEWGHLDVLECLLAFLPDIEAKNSIHEMPLHVAAKRGHLASVRALVENGAHVDARNNNQQTPLHLAAAGGYAQIVHYLLSKEADAHAQDAHKITPLRLALTQVLHTNETIKYLLKHGVFYSKADKRKLDSAVPDYKNWIKQEKERLLERDLKGTYVEALPRDLQGLLLEFVLSQTEPKRGRDFDYTDTEQSSKKHRR